GQAGFVPAMDGKPLQADWSGAVEVKDVDLQDRVNKAPFLVWKRLALDKMHITMKGPALNLGLGDIQLEDFYGNILLNSNARLNVMDIVVDKGQAGGSITQDTQTRREPAAAKPQAS